MILLSWYSRGFSSGCFLVYEGFESSEELEHILDGLDAFLEEEPLALRDLRRDEVRYERNLFLCSYKEEH